ncbi:MAG: hypothetical protein MJ014_02255 [Methanocorpusculum sp.]|nr:hypothetical protein [Methanocorpusculum sp.]
MLVTGHDLRDLEMLLEQTKGTSVDVYTHGEMLIAHAHPTFKQYDNLIANYGTSWANQKDESPKFNGPVLFTTNCHVHRRRRNAVESLQPGRSGLTEPCTSRRMPTSQRLRDYCACEKCKAPVDLKLSEVTTGAGHDAVLAFAPNILKLITEKKIRRFVVMAGYDGWHEERSYYTEFAKTLPKDVIILTAGCANYRYNRLDLGEIDGIPRVLDAGLCNDSYSLVVIATERAKALKSGKRTAAVVQHCLV